MFALSDNVSFWVCILAVGFLWLTWKFEANQFRSDDLADITQVFYFAYGCTFLPGCALCTFCCAHHRDHDILRGFAAAATSQSMLRHIGLLTLWRCPACLPHLALNIKHPWHPKFVFCDSRIPISLLLQADSQAEEYSRYIPGILPNDLERICVVFTRKNPDINLKRLGKNVSDIF